MNGHDHGHPGSRARTQQRRRKMRIQTVRVNDVGSKGGDHTLHLALRLTRPQSAPAHLQGPKWIARSMFSRQFANEVSRPRGRVVLRVVHGKRSHAMPGGLLKSHEAE